MSRIGHLWQRLPVVLRAVLGGFVVQLVGFAVLATLIPLNLRYLTHVPWTLAPLGLALWAYWSYFGGRGWPAGTADARRRLRRSNPVPARLRARVMVAGGLFSATVFAVSLLQYALRSLPPESLGLAMALSELPSWTAVPLALAAALFVGVGEELSFRGYMQVPIEDRHGPWLGLTVPALVFALSHGIDPVILPVFFVVSIGWSYLAWTVDSIRPGVVFHALIDGVAFLWAIFRIEDLRAVTGYSLIEDGWTPGYRALLLVTLLLAASTVLAFRALHRAARTPASSRGA